MDNIGDIYPAGFALVLVGSAAISWIVATRPPREIASTVLGAVGALVWPVLIGASQRASLFYY